MPRVRVGVVLLLPQPLATEIDGVRRGLGDPSRARIAPHVTLVPPVNVRHDDIPAAYDRIRAATADVAPLELEIGPGATFAPVSPVAYLEVVEADPARSGTLASLRSQLLAPPLERRSEHPFVPHVTVGDDLSPERLDAAVATLAGFRARAWIDRAHLLVRGPDRTWRPAFDVPLGARTDVVGRGGLPLALTTSDLPGPAPAALLDGAPGGHRSFTVTATSDGEVVGAAHGWTSATVLHLARVVVVEGRRRLGTGRHLLAAVEALGRARRCTSAVTVAPDAATAALLEATGWRRTGSDLPAPACWTRALG